MRFSTAWACSWEIPFFLPLVLSVGTQQLFWREYWQKKFFHCLYSVLLSYKPFIFQLRQKFFACSPLLTPPLTLMIVYNVRPFHCFFISSLSFHPHVALLCFYKQHKLIWTSSSMKEDQTITSYICSSRSLLQFSSLPYCSVCCQ